MVSVSAWDAVGNRSAMRSASFYVDNSTFAYVRLVWSAENAARAVLSVKTNDPAFSTVATIAAQISLPSGAKNVTMTKRAAGLFYVIVSNALFSSADYFGLGGAQTPITVGTQVFTATGRAAELVAALGSAPTGIIGSEYNYDYTWRGSKASGIYFAVVYGKAADGGLVKAKVKFAVVK